jgi:hypothetical protein
LVPAVQKPEALKLVVTVELQLLSLYLVLVVEVVWVQTDHPQDQVDQAVVEQLIADPVDQEINLL